MNNRIKSVRETEGITQVELARRLNITVSWMNKIENGKVIPNVKIAIRIAKELNCRVEDIFFN